MLECVLVKPHIAFAVAATLTSSALVFSCAVGAEKKGFGDDFTDDAGGRDATPKDSAPPRDGSLSDTEPLPADARPPPDASGQDTSVADTSAPDTSVPDTSVPDASGCVGQVALLAGSSTAFNGAIRAGATWSSAAIAGGTAASPPAIVPHGAGFSAVFRAQGDALNSTVYSGGAWSVPVRIGAASTRDTPALALVAGVPHVVYQNTSFLYVHGTWTGAAWDGATDPVGTPQSFGPVAPAAAGRANELVVAFGGDSQGMLFVQSNTGGTWGASVGVAGTAVCASGTACGGAPGLVALPAGGASDLLALHVDKNTRLLMASTRNAASRVWTSHGSISAGTTSDEELSLSLAGGSRAVVAFRGQNGRGYAALADLGVSPPRWAAPLQLSASLLASPPRVAAGVCGDDAIAALVLQNGEVKVTRLVGAAWAAEEAVSGMGVARYASIATRP